MDGVRFFVALGIGWGLIVAQGAAAYSDGFFNHAQMHALHGIGPLKGYSFLQHLGMWADVPLTLILAYLVGKYRFDYLSGWSLAILVGWTAFWVLSSVFVYAKMGARMPEAHAHSGIVTTAGWLHVIYASLATWVVTMILLPSFMTPAVFAADLLTLSVALTIWAPLGIAKFSRAWTLDVGAIYQVSAELALIWGITLWRLLA